MDLNSLICFKNRVKYALTEPLMVKLARFWNNEVIVSEDMPLISIYTPTYNRRKELFSRAVPSVLSQTYKNWEWIIVDDGSKDDTQKCVENLQRSAGRHKIYYYKINKNKDYPITPHNHWLAGPVNAANEALKHIKGNWIARIDDDDLWTIDHLEKLLEFAIKNEHEFVSSDYEAVRYGNIKVIREQPIGGTQTWLYKSYLKFMKYNKDCWRKSWNAVNDTDLAERMIKAGVKTGYLENITAKVEPREGQDTIGLEAYNKFNIIR